MIGLTGGVPLTYKNGDGWDYGLAAGNGTGSGMPNPFLTTGGDGNGNGTLAFTYTPIVICLV